MEQQKLPALARALVDRNHELSLQLARALNERDAILAELIGVRLTKDDVERVERRCLWLHHGHDGVYGDDGEMQCLHPSHGPLDFRRMPLAELKAAVLAAKWS